MLGERESGGEGGGGEAWGERQGGVGARGGRGGAGSAAQ